VLADDSLMQELNDIVSFGLKEMKSKLNTGKELYEEVEQQVEIFPIGIQPLRTDEGYFFLNDYLQKLISVYHYEITIFESYKEQYRGIKNNTPRQLQNIGNKKLRKHTLRAGKNQSQPAQSGNLCSRVQSILSIYRNHATCGKTKFDKSNFETEIDM
jgi:hypothetical protein